MDVFISRLRKYVTNDKNIDIRTVGEQDLFLKKLRTDQVK